jgi:hypothetical protein
MYHLIGIDNDSDPETPITEEPFAKPSANSTLYFHQERPMTLYCACLVKVVDRTSTTLQFYGVNMGLEEPDTSKLHTVDLRDSEMIWPCLPSSKWELLNSTENYMILLINNKLVDDEPTLTAAKADDGGKWPKGSADKMLQLLAEQKTLHECLPRLRDMLDEKGRENFDILVGPYLKRGA